MEESEQNLREFGQDIYNRKVIAENLTKIIEAQNEPSVIAIDSEWGTGKTTFVTMWQNMLKSDEEYKGKFKTLYFNAWENDYIKDPLLALFSEMEKQIHEEDSKITKSINKVKDNIKPFATAALTTGISIVTRGFLNLDSIELESCNEQELVKLSQDIGKIAVKEILANKTVRAKFKEEVIEYQEKINKKIIFFIDELDRCRPTFAIELLEVIKHLFNIKNIIFVISIDKQQLSYSVSTIYGQNADTVGYLRRFFDLDYKLPKLDVGIYIDNKNEAIFKDKHNTDLFQIFIKEMFIDENFSLRDIDKAYYYINILLPLIKEFNVATQGYNELYIATISYLYAIFITTKIKKPILYKKIIDREYAREDIFKEFKGISLKNYKDNQLSGWENIVLEEFINTIMKPFLTLNLEAGKLNHIERSDKFCIGIKDNRQYIFDLTRLFNNKEMNVLNNLEFINSFQTNLE